MELQPTLANARTTSAEAPPPIPLEYAGRLPSRWPKLADVWRRVKDSGPLLPRPSWRTGGALLLVVVAAYLLSIRPTSWQHVKSHLIGQSNGSYPRFCYLRGLDAVATPNANGGLRIWNPWTGQSLFDTETPPSQLPPNPPPGRKAELWWIRASADESKLIARSDQMGDFIFDARSGKCLAELNTYLGPEAAKQFYFALGALSPDGSRLAIVSGKDELLLYDITGPSGKLLARRTLNAPQLPGSAAVGIQQAFHIDFAPDGQTVLVIADSLIWVGDAATLTPRLTLQPQYSFAGDVAFLRGGRELLALSRVEGDDQLRQYDLATGQLLRRWQMPGQPSTVVVSPGEARAVVALGYQASVVIDLADTSEAIARKGYSRRVPMQVWLNAPPPFFPDGRRMILAPEQPWKQSAYVVDSVTGHQTAALPSPRQGWVGQNIRVSPDGRQLMAEDNFNLHIYQQTGSESKWGVIATWQFWLLVASIGALVISLWRDARRSRQRWGRTAPLSRRRELLAIALVAAGGIALISPIVGLSGHHGYAWNLLGLEILLNDAAQWWTGGAWLIAIFAFYFFAGLGLVMGGRAWELIVGVMLLASIVIALQLVSHVGEFAEHPQMIYDRAWMLSPTWMAVAQVGWSVCALAALVARARDGHVAPVARKGFA